MEVKIPYRPRDQLNFIHSNSARFRVVVAHRRAGKTVACINELIKQALTTPDPTGRFAYIGPTYRQVKNVAWDYLKYYSKNIPGVKINESELKIDYPNNSRIILLGSDAADSLRGQFFNFIVIDEISMVSARTWTEILRPALSDQRPGCDPGKALFIGTPAGKNFFWELFQRAKTDLSWDSCTIKASSSGILPNSELEALRREMGESEYQQEMECSFDSALQHSFYGEFMQAAWLDERITRVPHDLSMPTWVALDLGWSDLTSIWFCQPTKTGYNLIDYHEGSRMAPIDIAQLIKNKGYFIERVIVPHDAFNSTQAAAGVPIATQLKSLGLRLLQAPKTVSKWQGIGMVKSILSKCYFDKLKCAQGIEALENYKIDFDEKLAVNRQKDIHDKFSHGADAFRYLAVAMPKSAGQHDIQTLTEVRAFRNEERGDPFAGGLSEGKFTPLNWGNTLIQ